MFCKKKISQNSQENTCASPQARNFVKKETLAQMFSCEFCEISKNTFTKYLWTAASVKKEIIQRKNLEFKHQVWNKKTEENENM